MNINDPNANQEVGNRDLEAKKLQLHWLLQITKAINYNLPASNLFEIYTDVLRDHLKVGRLVLFVHNEEWQIPVRYGIADNTPLLDPGKFISDLDSFTDDSGTQTPWMKQFDTIVPVLHKDTPLAYALIGDIDESVFHSKREIVTYIHTITNVIVVAIENKRMARESIKRAAMERELELAAQMQALLFPANLVTHSFLDIAATYIPHQSVGGDYYDFIPINEDEAFVCMADVSGKGLSAAMLMSNFQANLHALITHTDYSLEKLVTELNTSVNKSAKGEKFITFFIGRINRKKEIIEYINAGHNPPVVIYGNKINILDQGTTGLGMLEVLPFLHHGTSAFRNGSLLFCYTDGITEMENSRGEVFGEQNLSELLTSHHKSETMEQMHRMLVEHFDNFRGELEFPDDVTFLSIRYLNQ